MPTESERTDKGGGIVNALRKGMHKVTPRMSTINVCSALAAIALAIAAITIMRRMLDTQAHVDATNEAYQSCQGAVDQLRETSDFLTTEARQFVATGKRMHLDNYLTEITAIDRRGKALETLRAQATSEEAIEALENARRRSDLLSDLELYALRLEAEALGITDLPSSLANVTLSPEDAQLSVAQKEQLANDMLNGSDYAQQKFGIYNQVNKCTELLVGTLRNELDQSYRHLAALYTAMNASVIALLLVVLFVILSTRFLLLWPISLYEKNIRNGEPLEPGGAQELRYLTAAYNEMYLVHHEHTQSLDHEAHHDALTGLFNRGAFDELLTLHRQDSALLLVDIDNFKLFNDTYGHEMGDAILVEVAATLYSSFRSTDHVCRIGGDEFAVIMTGVDASLRNVVAHKLKKIAAFLRDDSNGLPPATISAGIAFGWPGCKDDELFQKADAALYQTKENGRDGFTFAEQAE